VHQLVNVGVILPSLPHSSVLIRFRS
jgi:hypothetical protein